MKQLLILLFVLISFPIKAELIHGSYGNDISHDSISFTNRLNISENSKVGKIKNFNPPIAKKFLIGAGLQTWMVIPLLMDGSADSHLPYYIGILTGIGVWTTFAITTGFIIPTAIVWTVIYGYPTFILIKLYTRPDK